VESGVQLFGHAETITDPGKRQSLLENALQPLLERYGDHPRIIWDVINEPEGAMIVEGGNWVGGAVPATTMQEFVNQVVDLIHAEATQPVTVGSASRGMLEYWTASYLDFYQFHYYDHMESRFPIDVPASVLGLDKPVIVGEFPTLNSRYTMVEYLNMIWENGYVGAFPWSYRAGDSVSQFDGITYCEWARAHFSDQESLRCSVTPTTPTSTPTAMPTLTLPPTRGPTLMSTDTATPMPPYASAHVRTETGIHCQVTANQTGQVVLTTWAEFTTFNDVKVCGFSSDLKKFAAAYHYGHAGRYTLGWTPLSRHENGVS
jgi:hypothetical protein